MLRVICDDRLRGGEGLAGLRGGAPSKGDGDEVRMDGVRPPVAPKPSPLH